jgi:hypothetical protein
MATMYNRSDPLGIHMKISSTAAPPFHICATHLMWPVNALDPEDKCNLPQTGHQRATRAAPRHMVAPYLAAACACPPPAPVMPAASPRASLEHILRDDRQLIVCGLLREAF